MKVMTPGYQFKIIPSKTAPGNRAVEYVIYVVGGLMLALGVALVIRALAIPYPYGTLGYFIERRRIEKVHALGRGASWARLLFLKNVVSATMIILSLCLLIVLLALNAANLNDLRFLSLLVVLTANVLFQAIKMWESADEDVFCDENVVGIGNVACMARACGNVHLKLDAMDHFSLTSFGALQKVTGALTFEALYGKSWKHGTGGGLAKVLKTPADVARLRKILEHKQIGAEKSRRDLRRGTLGMDAAEVGSNIDGNEIVPV